MLKGEHVHWLIDLTVHTITVNGLLQPLGKKWLEEHGRFGETSWMLLSFLYNSLNIQRVKKKSMTPLLF